MLLEQVTDFASALRCPRELFARVHREWLEAGILWPPSQFECGFVSTAHEEADIDRAVAVFGASLTSGAAVATVLD